MAWPSCFEKSKVLTVGRKSNKRNLINNTELNYKTILLHKTMLPRLSLNFEILQHRNLGETSTEIVEFDSARIAPKI